MATRELTRDDFEQVIFSEHPDIGIVIPYKNSILVDAVRQLEREANFRPFEAKARVFLIDEAEKLNAAKDNAANALLKTLEEPPATSYIFLVSSRPDTLLPTIRSRCQTVRFAPISTPEIEKFLIDSKKSAPADAALLARIACGSLERASKIELGKFRERRDATLKILESVLLRKDRAALLQTAEDMNDAKNKDNYDERLEILEILIRDVWNLTLGADEEAIVNFDIKTTLAKLAAEAESKLFAVWLAEIEKMRENFSVNINRKIATDALFMQMADSV